MYGKKYWKSKKIFSIWQILAEISCIYNTMSKKNNVEFMGTVHPFGSPIDLEPSFSKNQKLFANLFDTAHDTTNKGIFHALSSPSFG